MRFVHFADVHLGGWREPKMRRLNIEAFQQAIQKTLELKPEFLLLAGDLFNTSLPNIETLREAVIGLKRLREAGIRVYAVAGSHDFSPSGNSMLDVLEGAGLLVNVARGEELGGKLRLKPLLDEASGCLITGLPGRKGGLEAGLFEALDRDFSKGAAKLKLFLFHTAINEFKPKGMESMPAQPLSILPEGFDYYAGGHVHEPLITKTGNGAWVVMPGPLFPNNFAELEKLKRGTMIVCEVMQGNIQPEIVNIPTHTVFTLSFDVSGNTPEGAQRALLASIEELGSLKEGLLLLRLFGRFSNGSLSELDFAPVFDKAYALGAYFVMRNTSQVEAPEFRGLSVEAETPDAAEERVIMEHSSGLPLFRDREKAVIRALLRLLSEEKKEGENKGDYEARLWAGFAKELEGLGKAI